MQVKCKECGDHYCEAKDVYYKEPYKKLCKKCRKETFI